MRRISPISAIGLGSAALALFALAAGKARAARSCESGADLSGFLSELRSGAIEPERRAALEKALEEGLRLGEGFRFQLSAPRPIAKARCGTELLSGRLRHAELPELGVSCNVHPSLEWSMVGSLTCIVDEPRSDFAREQARAGRHYRTAAIAAALRGVLDAARALRSGGFEPFSISPSAGVSEGAEPDLRLNVSWKLPPPEEHPGSDFWLESAPWVGQLDARLALDVRCARAASPGIQDAGERAEQGRSARALQSVDLALERALRLLAEVEALPGRTSAFQPTSGEDSYLVWRDLPLPRGASLRFQLVARLVEQGGVRSARVRLAGSAVELPCATLGAALRQALCFADAAGEQLGLSIYLPPDPEQTSLGTILALSCPLEDEPLRTRRARMLGIELPAAGEPVARELELQRERPCGPAGNDRWRASPASSEVLDLGWRLAGACADGMLWPPSATLGNRQGEVFGGTVLLRKP